MHTHTHTTLVSLSLLSLVLSLVAIAPLSSSTGDAHKYYDCGHAHVTAAAIALFLSLAQSLVRCVSGKCVTRFVYSASIASPFMTSICVRLQCAIGAPSWITSFATP